MISLLVQSEKFVGTEYLESTCLFQGNRSHCIAKKLWKSSAFLFVSVFDWNLRSHSPWRETSMVQHVGCTPSLMSTIGMCCSWEQCVLTFVPIAVDEGQSSFCSYYCYAVGIWQTHRLWSRHEWGEMCCRMDFCQFCANRLGMKELLFLAQR